MRMSCSLVVGLAWLCAMALAPTVGAQALLPGEQIVSAQSADAAGTNRQRAVGVWDQAAAWVWTKQREFHRALTRELRELRGSDDLGWTLVWMSFLYGVLHAAGPGHGKAVLTTYLLTHRQKLYRGVAMGTVAALLQGLTALILVYGLIGVAGWLPRETEAASLWAARVSFGLLTVVGLYLLVRATTSVVQGVRQWRHDIRHDHHSHAHDESCGCKHVPSTDEIETAGSSRAMAGVVLAIGLRPCSGAVLVLILAAVMGLAWHGAFAVVAMSLGTAMTIVTLAVLATKAREWAGAVVAHRSPVWVLASSGVGVLGGGLLLTFGLLLLSTSFSARSVLLS